MFCRCYYNCQNPKEAAIKSGYPSEKAEKIAQNLLSKKQILNYIRKSEKNFTKEKFLNLALIALKRIIFFTANDAVKLTSSTLKPTKEELEQLDLFQVSEIKKLKDGGFELKFIDKLKAIETLLAVLEKNQNKTQVDSFLKALTAKPAYEDNE